MEVEMTQSQEISMLLSLAIWPAATGQGTGHQDYAGQQQLVVGDVLQDHCQLKEL